MTTHSHEARQQIARLRRAQTQTAYFIGGAIVALAGVVTGGLLWIWGTR